MTLRYAHLSPRYLADEVGTLDRFQKANSETSQNASREDSLLTRVRRRSHRAEVGQQAVKADKLGQAMRGIGKE